MVETEVGAATQQRRLLQAERLFGGGQFSNFAPLPEDVAIVVARGQGSHIWDLNGREYVDFLMGSGPMFLGHAHPSVVAAVTEQVKLGSHFHELTEMAIQLADEIVSASPCAEKMRFAMTGSEAASLALRLARGYTGRRKILKFEGGYHGNSDQTIVSSKQDTTGDYPRAKPDSAGLPPGSLDSILVAPYNDIETTRAIIERNAGDLAAVIAEPLQRVIKPKPGFLQAVREITKQFGIVLIFDEVVTGFRLAYGGAQEFYGVVPDMATYGKAIGGGYPMAAIVGKAEIMDLCDVRRKGSGSYVYLSGTLNAYPVGAVAGLATLAELRKPGVYERLHEVGRKLRSGLTATLKEEGFPGQAVGEGPMLQLLFTDCPVIENYRDWLTADRKLGWRVGHGLLKRGIYVNPGEKTYISLAHTDEELDHYVGAVREVLREIKKQ